MTETRREVVILEFELKLAEDEFDPVKVARARALHIWRKFGIEPSAFTLQPQKSRVRNTNLIKFPSNARARLLG